MDKLSPALLLLAAIAAGAAMDASIKYLGQTNHVLIVVLGRYVIGAVFSAMIWTHAGRPRITPGMWRAHGLRGLVISGMAVSFFWALTVLPLAEAITLSFIYPLIVPFVARLMLGEQVRTSSIAGLVIGFAGVIVAAQGAPSQDQSPLHLYGVFAVLFSAALLSVSVVLMRQRVLTDGAPIVGLMSSLVPALILLAPAITFATPPRAQDWPGFLLMGAFASTFMYLMAHAYARAEAQQLAPIHYTELVWASLFGFLVFQEIPRVQIYFGAALIITACLYAAYDQRRLAIANVPAQPPLSGG